MPKTIRVGISFDKDFLKEVDEARGDIPRTLFVRRALEKAIKERGPKA